MAQSQNYKVWERSLGLNRAEAMWSRNFGESVVHHEEMYPCIGGSALVTGNLVMQVELYGFVGGGGQAWAISA